MLCQMETDFYLCVMWPARVLLAVIQTRYEGFVICVSEDFKVLVILDRLPVLEGEKLINTLPVVTEAFNQSLEN